MCYFTQRTVSLIREGDLIGAAKISTFQVADDSELEGTHKDLGAQFSSQWPTWARNPRPWCYQHQALTTPAHPSAHGMDGLTPWEFLGWNIPKCFVWEKKNSAQRLAALIGMAW